MDELSRLADEATVEPRWQDLGDFFRLRSRGQRRPAFGALERFLADATAWSFEDRLQICRWIAERISRFYDLRVLAPNPLATKLLAPTFREWTQVDPGSAEAHYLLAIFFGEEGSHPDLPARSDLLRRAIELDPSHDRARRTLLEWLTGWVEYQQHELPWGYLGDPAEDVIDLEEGSFIAAGIRDPDARLFYAKEINFLRQVAAAWIAFREAGGDDFGSWCAGRGIPRQSPSS